VKVEVRLEGVVTVPPAPDIILHAPVPIVGAFAASVTDVSPQVAAPVWSGPALEVDELPIKFITTSSVDAGQGSFEMVHLNV
jgi:hypothetical protein